MNILVANDDGIQAEGIARLTEALSLAGHDVYVIAPNGQRSAYSHAISINKDVLIRRVENYPFAREAYMVEGTPADCNHGANLGTDTMYSGTVSSAAEGAFLGLPAVAVSVVTHEPKHFEAVCKAAVSLLPYACAHIAPGSVININAPDLAESEIKGMRAAKLGNAKYDEWYYEAADDGETVTYRYAGTMVEDETWTDEMDTKLVREGYITVSAIKYDLNDYEGYETLKQWEEAK